ncbi:helix-turn-helix transcriptional regulator [Comamonas odontotermitis]|uniref:helix-turn-helix transcriptional regulator n=1 Tax=Comamonas odontotermitis TaxID=379895 RepID=UPI0037C0E142
MAISCAILYKKTVNEGPMEEGQKELLGVRLKEARKRDKMSQGYVSEVLQVTRQCVSAWETGASCPSAVQLAQLAMLYCTCAHTLLFGRPFQSPEVASFLAGLQISPELSIKE